MYTYIYLIMLLSYTEKIYCYTLNLNVGSIKKKLNIKISNTSDLWINPFDVVYLDKTQEYKCSNMLNVP